MGYEVTRFVGKIDQEFLCSICTMVFEDAQQSPCDHLFCKKCIMAWLQTERSCPVDHSTLEAVDLKPVARFFRKLLEKFMIKCDFEQQGCEEVIQLENLHSHVISCTRNPNAEVFCDKGCNLKIRRCEYEIALLSNSLVEKDLEITRLTALSSCLKEENKQLNDEMNRQREENTQINDANRRQRLQIIRFLLKCRRSENIKFTGEAYDALEIDNTNRTAFAQLAYSLESDFFFGIQILEWNAKSWIVVGLTGKQYPSNIPPGWSKESIGFSSYGTVQIDSTSVKIGSSWTDGDTIHCGISHERGFFSVIFSTNGKRVAEKFIQMPRDGLYPTVWMWNAKVRYLTQ